MNAAAEIHRFHNGSARESATTRYRCAAGVGWVVETRGLTLFRADLGAFCGVPYPFAAIWDLLQRGYRIEDTARLTGYIAAVPPDRARDLVLRAIRGWVTLGVLDRKSVV